MEQNISMIMLIMLIMLIEQVRNQIFVSKQRPINKQRQIQMWVIQKNKLITKFVIFGRLA